MEKISNIFWKIFSAIMVFAYNNNFADAASTPEQITLCPENQYVASCGKHTIGTQWLRGYYIKADGDSRQYSQAFNYYSDTTDNTENLRKFFGTNCTDNNCDLFNQETESLEDPTDNRNTMLSQFCNPAYTRIGCKPCPNNGTVEESTVEMNNTSSEGRKPVEESWNIHTFADCKVSEFRDSTGTYSYFDDNDLTTPLNCYYSSEIPGSDLRYYYG